MTSSWLTLGASLAATVAILMTLIVTGIFPYIVAFVGGWTLSGWLMRRISRVLEP